jgi:UDP-N-acetylmuramate: L-alanyl-gamma-D-glutamyl-meso-diaminopimelate ligase
MGLDCARLSDGFRSFTGVKRRQEIRGQQRGVLVMDDFAHHPTAVRETLDAVRAAYRGRRIWAVFEPRSNTSKRNIFEQEFASALALADRILLAGVHQPEKVPDGERLSIDNLVGRINRLCGDDRAGKAASATEIAAVIARDGQPKDVVLVMSNGGFDNVHERILRALAS